MRITWTTYALTDLQHIYQFINQDSPQAATAVLVAIRRAIRGQLLHSPLAGRTGRVQGTRELVIPRLPFIVAYRIKGDQIQILRVLHGAQRWPNALE